MAVSKTVVAAGVGQNFNEIVRTSGGVERRRARQGDWCGSIIVRTTASAAEVGRICKEKNPNRQGFEDGASKDADTSRICVGTTLSISPKNNIPQTGVSLSAARLKP